MWDDSSSSSSSICCRRRPSGIGRGRPNCDESGILEWNLWKLVLGCPLNHEFGMGGRHSEGMKTQNNSLKKVVWPSTSDHHFVSISSLAALSAIIIIIVMQSALDLGRLSHNEQGENRPLVTDEPVEFEK